ncbi:ABC transporter ATP-binding protein [Hahella ganghwensis]|uniref:ABC transporter ATP-binding protein n=1 Tax=Hahella ganghwensis TaxID=286420 RepID=UPI00036F5141|nr:ABC transporter ATP-binding protein [Hahella ganghwensis]
MIELKNLSMSYPMRQERLQILTDVNLTITQGETVAIIGPSGSGKTTLLLLLAGLEQAESGEIKLINESLGTMDHDQLADLRRDHLGIVFQSFHLIPSLTALNNVSLPLEIAGQKDARLKARQMLNKVDLQERADHFPSQLSGGEQQRVAIARALVHSPKLVLADEPTGNLDLHTGDRITELLFTLNEESGSTMVMVTHDEQIAKRCQRVLRLHQGQLVEDEHHALPA